MNTLSDTDEGRARPSVCAVYLAVGICFAAALTDWLLRRTTDRMDVARLWLTGDIG